MKIKIFNTLIVMLLIGFALLHPTISFSDKDGLDPVSKMFEDRLTLLEKAIEDTKKYIKRTSSELERSEKILQQQYGRLAEIKFQYKEFLKLNLNIKEPKIEVKTDEKSKKKIKKKTKNKKLKSKSN